MYLRVPRTDSRPFSHCKKWLTKTQIWLCFTLLKVSQCPNSFPGLLLAGAPRVPLQLSPAPHLFIHTKRALNPLMWTLFLPKAVPSAWVSPFTYPSPLSLTSLDLRNSCSCLGTSFRDQPAFSDFSHACNTPSQVLSVSALYLIAQLSINSLFCHKLFNICLPHPLSLKYKIHDAKALAVLFVTMSPEPIWVREEGSEVFFQWIADGLELYYEQLKCQIEKLAPTQ